MGGKKIPEHLADNTNKSFYIQEKIILASNAKLGDKLGRKATQNFLKL